VWSVWTAVPLASSDVRKASRSCLGPATTHKAGPLTAARSSESGSRLRRSAFGSLTESIPPPGVRPSVGRRVASKRSPECRSKTPARQAATNCPNADDRSSLPAGFPSDAADGRGHTRCTKIAGWASNVSLSRPAGGVPFHCRLPDKGRRRDSRRGRAEKVRTIVDDFGGVVVRSHRRLGPYSRAALPTWEQEVARGSLRSAIPETPVPAVKWRSSAKWSCGNDTAAAKGPPDPLGSMRHRQERHRPVLGRIWLDWRRQRRVLQESSRRAQRAGLPAGMGEPARGGASSMTTWALVPPTPNEPHLPGGAHRASPWLLQGVSSASTRNGLFAKLIFGWACGNGGAAGAGSSQGIVPSMQRQTPEATSRCRCSASVIPSRRNHSPVTPAWRKAFVNGGYFDGDRQRCAGWRGSGSHTACALSTWHQQSARYGTRHSSLDARRGVTMLSSLHLLVYPVPG